MVAVAAATRIRKIGWKEYMLIWLRRDIAIVFVWILLLCIWIKDTTA